MSILDIQANFSANPSNAYTSVVGAAGTYIAANSYDTSPLGAYLTELSAADTQLSANVNTFRDLGGGAPMWWVVDWIQAPNNLTSVDMQLVTSAASSLSSPVVMVDLTAIAIATLIKGYRQLIKLPRSASWLQWIGVQAVTAGTTSTTGQFISWLALDIDAVQLGYASGYSVK